MPRVSLAPAIVLVLLAPAPLLAHGDLHEQIAAVTKEIEKDPGNAALYLKRGELERAHRDFDAALKDYDAARQLAPALDEVEFCRGRALLEAGRAEPAKAALDRFLAAHPGDADGLVYRARALVKLGAPLPAAEDYASAIARFPKPKPDYYAERAEALVSAGAEHREAALKGLDDGIRRLGPLVSLELPAIDIELALSRWDAALARLDRLAAQSERKESWLARRAEVLEKAGRAGEARDAYRRALEAIESLPPRARNTPATTELERRVRAALSAPAPTANPG